MPKETRTSSGAKHRSRVEPYPTTRPAPAPASSTVANTHILPSSSAPLPIGSCSPSPSNSAALAPPPPPTMDGIVSSPPQTMMDPSMNPTFSMTSPGSNDRPSIAWSEEDDHKLMILRSKNLNWIAIAQNFPGKTGNACRKRHERLVEKRNAQGWDSVRLADLAIAYMDCREDIWRMVAARCGGEKWQTIEQKCMEKGFKTLSSAARASRRHGSNGLPIQHPSDSLEDSPEHYTDETMGHQQFRDSGYYDSASIASMNGKAASYDYHFGTQPSNDTTFFCTAPAQNITHSRRPSATHSIGPYSVDHSSRSNSHGPSMAPPIANNPFASPQPYYADPTMTTMATSLGGNPAIYPIASGRNMVSNHRILPSIANGAFEPPMGARLPSIVGSQG